MTKQFNLVECLLIQCFFPTELFNWRVGENDLRLLSFDHLLKEAINGIIHNNFKE